MSYIEKLESLKDLVEISRHLLQYCPEDSKTTMSDWLRYLRNEVAELDEVLGSEKEPDEMGDVLGCAVMLMLLGNGNPAQEVCRKLIRRHPGVFGDPTLQFQDLMPIDTIDKAKEAWIRAKRLEKQPNNPIMGLPDLSRANDSVIIVQESRRTQLSPELLFDAKMRTDSSNRGLIVGPSAERLRLLANELVKKFLGVLYHPGRSILTWPNGASVWLLGSGSPDRLRGLRVNVLWRYCPRDWSNKTEMDHNILFATCQASPLHEIIS